MTDHISKATAEAIQFPFNPLRSVPMEMPVEDEGFIDLVIAAASGDVPSQEHISEMYEENPERLYRKLYKLLLGRSTNYELRFCLAGKTGTATLSHDAVRIKLDEYAPALMSGADKNELISLKVEDGEPVARVYSSITNPTKRFTVSLEEAKKETISVSPDLSLTPYAKQWASVCIIIGYATGSYEMRILFVNLDQVRIENVEEAAKQWCQGQLSEAPTFITVDKNRTDYGPFSSSELHEMYKHLTPPAPAQPAKASFRLSGSPAKI